MLSTKVRKLVNKCTNIVHTHCLPPACVLCGQPGQAGLDLCEACHVSLERIPSPCPRCGMPLHENTDSVCGQCLKTPPPFQLTLSPYRYAPPLIRLVADFKFNHQLKMARVLNCLLSSDVASRTRPDCLIPVPLHPKRLAERGYNQALEIARGLGKTLDVPVDYRLCQRIRHTTPQTGLDAKARKNNIRGAFAINGECKYKHVAIVDDVITTGQTVTELARLLAKNGVEKIEVWSVARAIPE